MNSDFILAVHALVYLCHKADTVSSEALAENICTNPARVRRVMTRLKKAGLVETRGWRENGGYYLPPPASRVDLRMVGEALDVSFVSTDWRSGDPHMECRVASGITGVVDGIFGELNLLCRDHLKEITIEQITNKLFEN